MTLNGTSRHFFRGNITNISIDKKNEICYTCIRGFEERSAATYFYRISKAFL